MRKVLAQAPAPVLGTGEDMKLDTNSMRDYDIACTLRECDLPGTGNLKWALTCRIRHLVGSHYALARRRRVDLVQAEAALAEVKAHKGHLSHYLSHIYQAASYLGGTADLRILALALMGESPPTPERLIELAGGD